MGLLSVRHEMRVRSSWKEGLTLEYIDSLLVLLECMTEDANYLGS